MGARRWSGANGAGFWASNVPAPGRDGHGDAKARCRDAPPDWSHDHRRLSGQNKRGHSSLYRETSIDAPEGHRHMKKRTISTILAAISTVALSATAVLAGQPVGAGDHGAAVSAVAKAHDAVSGRAHGEAVSALAKTHGAEVSAAARAKGAAAGAAGRAKGASASAAGKAKGAAAATAGKAIGAAASEPGRLKAAAAAASAPDQP
jgi:hypothetical protein